jgi:hypothetical protein
MHLVAGVGLAVLWSLFYGEAHRRVAKRQEGRNGEGWSEEKHKKERSLPSTEDEGRAPLLDSGLEPGQPLYGNEILRDRYQAVPQLLLFGLQCLVTSDVDLEHRYGDGKRVLHPDCESGSLQVCRFLLNCSVNFAARDCKGRTLIVCRRNRRLDILRHLMSLGIDAFVRDSGGRTVVLIAVKQGNVGVQQYPHMRFQDNTERKRKASSATVTRSHMSFVGI